MKKINLSKIKDYAYSLEKYHLKNFHSDFLKIIIDDLKYDMNSNIIRFKKELLKMFCLTHLALEEQTQVCCLEVQIDFK